MKTRVEASSKKAVEVDNPAYKGATPEMVGRALLRNTKDSKPNQNAGNKKGDPKAT